MYRLLTVGIILTLVLPVFPATRYVDYPELTVINRADASGSSLSRLDVTEFDSLPANVAKYGNHSTGVALMFSTNSPYIKAKWRTKHLSVGKNTSPLLQSGLDLYIRSDSAWIHAGVGLPSDSLEHKATLVDNMDSTAKDCLLYLPLWNDVESLEIGVADSAFCNPIRPGFGKRMVIVGSSITHGAAASRPGMAYPARLERALNVECVNLGFSGLCKLEPFYADFITSTPADLYVIDAFSNPSPEQIHSRLKPFVDRIRSMKPDVPLIFLQTEIRETGNFDLKKRDFEYRKRMAAEQEMNRLINEGYRNIHFINPAMPLGDSHEMTVDGVHPSDAGFQLIIEHLIPIIKQFL